MNYNSNAIVSPEEYCLASDSEIKPHGRCGMEMYSEKASTVGISLGSKTKKQFSIWITRTSYREEYAYLAEATPRNTTWRLTMDISRNAIHAQANDVQ